MRYNGWDERLEKRAEQNSGNLLLLETYKQEEEIHIFALLCLKLQHRLRNIALVIIGSLKTTSFSTAPRGLGWMGPSIWENIDFEVRPSCDTLLEKNNCLWTWGRKPYSKKYVVG